MIVKNQFPVVHNQPYRLAVIGEAPGRDEDEEGKPFVGQSGRFLNALLSQVGILRDACFVGNVCQHKPPNNNLALLGWNSDEVTAGIDSLIYDLKTFQPNLVLLLGNAPLHLMKVGSAAPKIRKTNGIPNFAFPNAITNWRGSLFKSDTLQWKCLPSLHPAYCLRDYSGTPLLRFDLRKAAIEARTAELVLPQRNLITNLTSEEIIWRLNELLEQPQLISIDIEGGINTMSCLSVAPSAGESFIVPMSGHGHLESQMWKSLASVLTSPLVPKVLQNCLYDMFVLQYSYGIAVRGVVDDTMLKHWELYCELPKSLGFQCSVHTREPYYKEDRTSDDKQTFHEYCCRDSAVTYEINTVLDKQLTTQQRTCYNFTKSLLEPILYMELKGINYDHQKAKERLGEVEENTNRLQWALNEVSGRILPNDLLSAYRDAFCYKREANAVKTYADVLGHTKTTCLHLATRAIDIITSNEKASNKELTHSQKGLLSTLLGLELNVDSKTQLPHYLYKELGLPVQFKKEKGKLTDKETTDALALLTLYKKTQDEILKLILTIRSLKTRAETLGAKHDTDNRIRCGYNVVGTETGRLSCYESPTGSGFNLQTVAKRDRDLFLPDQGYWLFQCDLSGADGWTVAAHCKACGDATMLEDYLYGLKPARIIALMYTYGAKVAKWDRATLKERGKEVDGDGWLYFACKRVQHGSNYGMKGQTMSDQILKDSYKITGVPIFVEPAVCTQLQQLYLSRYIGVLHWHSKIKRQLKDYGYLISASGHKRIFFGRRDDYDTFKQACAEEPQNNTTYATNLALLRLWTDADNVSYVNGKWVARIQPLHTIHDALVGQFHKEDTAWATSKIREYFNNTLTIAGQKITIPFEGHYGESWGKLKEGTI